jgi:hypothetical protein
MYIYKRIYIYQFVRVLAEYGIIATPRTRRGIDIEAGCGQLTTGYSFLILIDIFLYLRLSGWSIWKQMG